MIWQEERRQGERRAAQRLERDRRKLGPTRAQQREAIAMALPWGFVGVMLLIAWGLS